MKKFMLSVAFLACGSLAIASEGKGKPKDPVVKSYFAQASDAVGSAKTAVCDFSHNWVGQYVESHPYYAMLVASALTVLVIETIKAAQAAQNEDEL